MTLQPWWQEWPGLLGYELAELDGAGIRYELEPGAPIPQREVAQPPDEKCAAQHAPSNGWRTRWNAIPTCCSKGGHNDLPTTDDRVPHALGGARAAAVGVDDRHDHGGLGVRAAFAAFGLGSRLNGCELTVRLSDGRELQRRVEEARGTATNPATRAEVDKLIESSKYRTHDAAVNEPHPIPRYL